MAERLDRICFSPVRAAVGDMFSEEEINDVIERLGARYTRLKRGNATVGDNDPALWKEAFESLAVEEVRDKLIEKRMKAAAALAKKRRWQLYDNFDGDEGEALSALMVGDTRQGFRRAASVDAQGKAAEVESHSRYTQALDAKGALSRLADPLRAFAPDRDFEDEVAKEIARLNGEQRAPSDNAEATAIAEIHVADQTRVRAQMNRLGAWIGKLDGYISRTMHDPIKISGGFWKGLMRGEREAARKRWVDFIAPLLHERTFEKTDELALQRLDRQIRREAKAQKREMSDAQIAAAVEAGADDAIAKARLSFLETIWTDIVSGYRAGVDSDVDDLDGFTPPSSLARQLSRRRVLHWDNAEAWIKYNREFGAGSIFVSHLSFLSRAARTEALMRNFGPSPEAAFAADQSRLAAKARARGDTAAVKRLNKRLRTGEFDQLTGAAERPESHRVATFSRGVRSWQQLSKLGGMIFSSVTDLGNGAQALHRAGVDYLKTYSGLVGSVGNIADPVMQREVANLVGEGARTMAGDIAAQFVEPTANMGLSFKASRLFYRANLFQFWQARLRAGAGRILAGHLGERRSLAWGSLDAPSREALERYGIDARGWDMLRNEAAQVDGQWVLTPDAAERVDGAAVAGWGGKAMAWNREAMAAARAALGEKLDDIDAATPLYGNVAWTGLRRDKREALQDAGVSRALWDRLRTAAGDEGRVTGATLEGLKNDTIGRELKIAQEFRADDIEDARRELMLRLQAYFTDQIDDAMTEPRARERARLRLGTQAGTAAGVAVELLMQFKSFPLAVIMRHLGPAIAESQARRSAAPIAHFLVATTALGYVAMTMKDVARGLKPMPLEDEEGNPNLQVLTRAFIQGGGAGLYADFIFGDYDRFGRSPLAAVAGPSIGEFERVAKIFAQVRALEFGDAGADAMRLTIDNTPFLNLFYARAALNYLFLYQLQEAISPGYLRRMEQQIRENRGGQEYFAPPSAAAGSAR